MYSFIYQFPGITKEETKNKKLKVIDVVYGKSPSFLKKGQEKDLFHPMNEYRLIHPVFFSI